MNTPSPFHAGEQALQQRVGIRTQMEDFGRRVIRNHLPQQHRDFYAGLQYLYIGSVDAQGRPWASMVTGNPGFISTPSDRQLQIHAAPHAGDPLADNLATGRPIGILGIDLSNRRRNRVNGRVNVSDSSGFTVDVDQAFGNCPKYIRVRDVAAGYAVTSQDVRTTRGSVLDERLSQMVGDAETFFIATVSPGADASAGADVSHRGGKPGFVRLTDGRTLTFPDFGGNGHFNTFGNLEVCDRAGLLFIDFHSGHVLQLSGRAQVIWEGEALTAFEGAERLLTFELDSYIFSEGALGMRFVDEDTSPFLASTGNWETVASSVGASATSLELRVARIVDESANVRSFHLEPVNAGPIPDFQPGQFLPIQVQPSGNEPPVNRTYSLSAASDGFSYRISVKRESSGLVSQYLHDSLRLGATLTARPPRGDFVLDRTSDRPVVLLSAGIGITPMMGMLQRLAGAAAHRPVWFIHGARNGRELSFAEEIDELSSNSSNVHSHLCLSQPARDETVAYQSVGRVDVDLLRSLLPFGDYDFYLCGPGPFVASLHEGLRALNVAAERIHYELFGPSSLNQDDGAIAPSKESVEVSFAKSGVEITWKPDSGSLLDLAEEAGLSPDFGCRSGSCGSCMTKLRSGTIASANGSDPNVGTDDVLICSAAPATASEPLSLDL